jgi:hypothetical protein
MKSDDDDDDDEYSDEYSDTVTRVQFVGTYAVSEKQ